MKQFFAGLLLMAATFLAPLLGAVGDSGRTAPVWPHSINDDADPVGVSVDDSGGSGNKGGNGPSGRGEQKRSAS